MFIGNSYAFPSSILYFSIVHITNTQNISTSQPFQQMLNVSYSLYKGYAASNFQNVEFFYSNGTIIPSWLEGYNYSRNAIYWLKIGSIPASSSITIYIGFALNSTNLFNNKTTGEAPQLSSTYAEYDDGANVFYAYFNANTPKSDFNLNSAISFSTTTYKGTKAIQLTGVTDTRNGVMTYEKPLPNQAYLEFAYFAAPSTSDNNAESSVGLGNSETATSINYYDGDAPSSTGSFSVQGFSDGSWSDNSVGTGTTQWQIDNFTYVPASSNVNGCEISPQVYCDTYTNELTSQSTLYLSFFYADADGVQLDALYNWVFVSSYPPNGVMPSVEFGNEINVPNLSIDSIIGNVSRVYGSELNITANDNNSNYIRLLINNKVVTPYKKNSSNYFNYISAGLDKVTAEENLYNSSNYINVTYYANISKKAISQSLTVLPNNSFYYNGIAPVIIDSLNESLVSGNIINYSLLNGSTYLTYILSKNVSTNFSNISGKYASASNYLFKVSSDGNENYTIVNTPQIRVNISRALPRLSITATPTLNYSNNGTSLIFHFRISSVDNQLPGNFYINNTIENSSIMNGTYNASYQPNTFIAKLNTSGNENYTSNSIQKTMEIKLGKLYLYLNGFQSNLTVTYPQPLNVSAYSIPSTLPIKLYINNTLITSSNGSLHYLKDLAAGLYKITVATNSSGIANVSFYQKINKSVPKLVLYPYYYSQIYNGSGIPINLNISSVNNQLFYQLYVNSSIVFIDDSNVTYTTNASAGLYRIKLYSPGNQNYSGIALDTILKIEKAKPVLKLLLNPDKSFYYNGMPLSLHGVVYSFNNQLSANLYINNMLVGVGYNISYSNSAPIEYKIVLETLGNGNYSASFENFNLTIMNLTGKRLLVSKTKLFNQSIMNTVFNVSRLNYKEQATVFRLFPSYNLSIPMPYNITPVTALSMPVLSNLNKSIITIYSTKNSSCFGNSLSSVLYGFNDSVNVNENNFGEVTYLFSLHKSVLLADNLSMADISLYRCSTTDHNWQEIPTFLVNKNDTSANYKAVSPGFSQYVIAEGPSLLSVENSSLTVEYIYEDGLPANYRWNATINNVTLQSTSGSPILTLIPYGQFKIKFYNLSSYASNATYSCKITYLPNIPQNSSLLGIAGIPIVVNYSVSRICLPTHKSAGYNLFIEFKYEIITVVVLIVVFVSFIILYTKRKVRNKKYYKKKHNNRHVNRRSTKKNNHK